MSDEMNAAIRAAAGRMPRGHSENVGPQEEGEPGFEEAYARDTMNALIRGTVDGSLAEVMAEAEKAEAEELPPETFDHGARRSTPSPGPSANEQLRALWRASRRVKHADYWPEDADQTP